MHASVEITRKSLEPRIKEITELSTTKRSPILYFLPNSWFFVKSYIFIYLIFNMKIRNIGTKDMQELNITELTLFTGITRMSGSTWRWTGSMFVDIVIFVSLQFTATLVLTMLKLSFKAASTMLRKCS